MWVRFPPPALENRLDILSIWSIYAEVKGRGEKRQQRAEILNRAAIVFTAACWETFVEDLAVEAFDFMLAHAPTPDVIPMRVRTLDTKHLRDDKDERRELEVALGDLVAGPRRRDRSGPPAGIECDDGIGHARPVGRPHLDGHFACRSGRCGQREGRQGGGEHAHSCPL